MRLTRWTICLLLFIASGGIKELVAQNGGLDLEFLRNDKRVDLPFEIHNHFIVIPVRIGGLFSVNFIIDTGAEHSIILDKLLTDVLGTSYTRQFDIVGSDLSTTLTAHLAVGVDLKIGDDLYAFNRTILVLEENSIDFEGLTGVPIAGILGGDFLRRFVVEIDYRKQVVRLHEPSRFRVPRRYDKLPTRFRNNRAYVDAEIEFSNHPAVSRRLLIDSGASLGLLLLIEEENQLPMPDTTILAPVANGLGGLLMGSVGRTRNLRIGSRPMGGMVLYYQEKPTYLDSLDIQRQGILGNRALERYHLYIDYIREEVYARPVGRWPDQFPYDRSGLTISAGGPGLNRYQIINVVPGSPAYEAGLRRGDFIKRLNGTPHLLLTLEGIVRKLEGKIGKRIRIVAERNGLSFQSVFHLRDII